MIWHLNRSGRLPLRSILHRPECQPPEQPILYLPRINRLEHLPGRQPEQAQMRLHNLIPQSVSMCRSAVHSSRLAVQFQKMRPDLLRVPVV
jgi:hypothetical protein